MLDWTARIDALAHQLAAAHSVDDRPALEILLAALINCPRTPSSWLTLETNWYARECMDAWFSFGETWTPCSFARLRARSPWRAIEAEMKEMMESPSDEHLFVEPDFERYPYWNHSTQAHYLLQRCLRLRLVTTRTADPLRGLDKYNQERRSDELYALTRDVLEDRTGARSSDPPRFLEPRDFLYYCELVQKLAPWYRDWTELVQAFAVVAVRRAYLLGRSETDASDDRAMARVGRDSVPPWIAKALAILLDGPSQLPTLEKYMRLEDKTRRSGYGSRHEIVRLARNGAIWWNKQNKHWAVVERHRDGIRALLEGRAFGVERAATA